MRKLLTTLAICAAGVATHASAAVIGDFRLSGNTVNAAGGPLTLTNNGAVFSATGLTFQRNEGPTITGFASPTAYSVETRFSIDATAGYRKLLDFFNRTADSGLYNLSGYLNFYPVTPNTDQLINAGQPLTLVFTRDASGASVGYINGVQTISFTNAGLTALTTTLHLFRDDFATGQAEASPGFVDYIRIYDTALTGEQVAALRDPGEAGAVPEPATWALFIAGFGIAGASLRRRRPTGTGSHQPV